MTWGLVLTRPLFSRVCVNEYASGPHGRSGGGLPTEAMPDGHRFTLHPGFRQAWRTVADLEVVKHHRVAVTTPFLLHSLRYDDPGGHGARGFATAASMGAGVTAVGG